MDIHINELHVNLVHIYAPNKPADRIRFINYLNTKLSMYNQADKDIEII